MKQHASKHALRSCTPTPWTQAIKSTTPSGSILVYNRLFLFHFWRSLAFTLISVMKSQDPNKQNTSYKAGLLGFFWCGVCWWFSGCFFGCLLGVSWVLLDGTGRLPGPGFLPPTICRVSSSYQSAGWRVGSVLSK